MQRRTWWLIGGMATGWSILIGVLQYMKYHAFAYNGLDLGIYSQVLWSLSHGHGFASSVHDPSYLGDHLELWLVPVSWVYRVWSTPLTALWAQTLILASSVIPLAYIAKRVLNERAVPFVTGLFLLHPLLYNAAMYEFHAIVFALPITFGLIWAYSQHKYAWFLVGGISLLLVREDMPLVLAGFALFAGIERRSWRWWLIPGVVSIAYFLGAQAIIRAMNPLDSYKYLAFYQWLGTTPRDMLVFPFQHPLLFMAHVFSVYNWQTVISFFILFGFIPWFGGKRLWPLLFVFIQLLLLGAAADSILRLHYVIPYLPFLWWAALIGWKQLADGKAFPGLDQSLVNIGLVIIAIVAPLYGQMQYGALEWPWTKNMAVSRTPSAILQTAITSISPNDRVLTTFNLLPALSGREHVYALNYVHLGRRQYTESPYVVPTGIDVAIIDWQQYYDFEFLYLKTLYNGQTGADRLRSLLVKNDLQLASWVDGVAIYKKSSQALPEPVTHSPAPAITAPIQLVETSPIQVEPTHIGTWPQHIRFTTSWQLHETPEQPFSIRFSLIQNGKDVWSTTRMLGTGAWPSNAWAPNQRWTTSNRIAVPQQLHGEFKIKAQVLQLSGRMKLDRWRSFTPRIEKSEQLLSVQLGSVRL